MAKRESNSESEAKQPTRGVRARTAQQQAQQEFLSKHINSNGPQDKVKIDPLDFNAFTADELNNYSKRYNLGFPECQSLKLDVLNSEIGKKTLSSKKHNKGKRTEKIEKYELSHNLKQHFLSSSVKENEVITNFLYKVRNDDKDFKLEFK
ncbi:hypothetical protein PSN45_004315 [Yamadazyma tenuis]|uniref:Histone deacetylase complex subunit SAP30 Sin3 binding domain-containing protein n=1 Tax=Candida tenuis (strain ATCC 10573 / BCRC 21748 / CBS 615 / JCM 9827 / NBRC 10315 / NRRL Y-1498 / VKM Y-70) TaxID=590646 RepID=G3B680_CANTC|nr:uncharacterized protein CANTEDRAFT_106473 [Yamadazyma tenuis ATCC 10573]EGV63405.1 hypothetical protein CANTEDRAFT_106473 [Yamadazyma tenuis ATCC 10573]WEJ96772.1 hypothetical protein PSN45_004315 [Yamadazyma tenuis]